MERQSEESLGSAPKPGEARSLELSVGGEAVGRERERAGESLPAPGQSEMIGRRRNPCIAEGRTGSDRASTLIEHQLLSSINSDLRIVRNTLFYMCTNFGTFMKI